MVSQATTSQNKTPEEIKYKLEQAVKRQLIADVPVGLFLSGGLDSSAILGLMAQETNEKIESYSVGFSSEDLAFETTSSDLHYAQIMADHRNNIELGPK